MSGLLTIGLGGQQVVDQSGTLSGITIPLGTNVLVTKDSNTPSGDPVAVTLSGVGLGVGVTATVNNGATLTVDGLAAAGLGSSLMIGQGGTLELAPGVGAAIATPISFTGSSGTLQVDGTSLSLLSPVQGFTGGDLIDLRNCGNLTDVQMNNGVLSLISNGTQIGSMALSGVFDPATLGCVSDGLGGALIGLGLGHAASSGSGSAGGSGGMSGGQSSGASVNPGTTTGGTTVTGSTGGSSSGGASTSATITVSTGGSVGAQVSVNVNTTHDNVIVAKLPTDQFSVQVGVPTAVSTTIMANSTVLHFLDGVGVLNSSGAAEQVAHLYQAAFGRSADLTGLQYWTGQLEGNAATVVNAADSFASSTEFMGKYGQLSDANYVSQLYQNVLGRAADAAGQSYWQGQLASGCTRGQVLSGLAQSYENIHNTLSTTGDATFGEAYRLYQAALGRTPDQGGLSYWTNCMQAGTTAGQVAAGFVNSAEFQTEYKNLGNGDFVGRLYQNVLGRAADSSGADYWTSQLASGASRAQVLAGFSDSQENRAVTASATHDGWVFLSA